MPFFNSIHDNFSSRTRCHLLGAVLAFSLVGCGDSAGQVDKFVGTWHRPKYPDEKVVVTKESATRLIFVNHGDGGSKSSIGAPEIGELVGDRVVFNPMVSATLMSNGNMVYGSWEYTK